jgi:CBS domain-containing protein
MRAERSFASADHNQPMAEAPSGDREVADFLALHPPFDSVDPVELGTIAASVERRTFRTGEVALLEDGKPAQAFYVIRHGSMELVHDEEVIDILEPGEAFGHPSLLTGLAPAFTIRAHEDSTCFLVPRELALSVLGRPAGAGFVARTLRERLTRTGHVVHALPQLATVRVSELISRPLHSCEPFTTIRHAAETMTEHRVSAILVPDGERLTILTDADVRAKVVAGRLSPENPVSRVTEPAVTVSPDRLAVDAVVDMLDAGVEHLVVVEPPRNVVGIVSSADLMGLETHSPFALRHAVLRAEDEDELVEVAARLPRLFVSLLDAGVSAADVGRVLSLQLDSLTTRLIDFSIWRHGPAPVAWAWIVLGSSARRELTLGSDQENALAYAADGDPAVDAYFARLGERVSAGLARCGFKPDPNEVTAGNRLWRLPEDAWLQVFRDCLEQPDRSHLLRATVAFDFRAGGGGLDIVPPLVRILRTAPRHPDFLRRLGRTATDFTPPLGFRGSLVVERAGAESGKLDIKRGGTLPIVNLARFHALANGITISATLDRLVAARDAGALEPEVAAALLEALAIVSRIRLQHHAARIEAGEEPDNLIDPAQLPPITRGDLREAFRAVAQAQKRLGVYVPLGL